MQAKRSAAVRGFTVILGALFALVLSAATPVFAQGVGGAADPAFPSPMNVGGSYSGTLTLTNLADGIPHYADDTLVLTGVWLTPSCASGSGTCSTPDLDVFAISAATGAAGSACAGKSFIVNPRDATGEIQLTWAGTINLGPSIFGTGGFANLPLSQCVINYTITPLKKPAIDVDGATGIQTLQLARMSLEYQPPTGGSPVAGTGSGSGSAQVTAPNLAIAKTPDGQTISATDVATFTIVVTNNGDGAATTVTVADTLPSGGGVNWASTTPGCSVTGAPGSQVLNCTLGNLAVGASTTVVVSGPTTVQACTAMPNTARATATNNVQVAPNNVTVTDSGSITCVTPVMTIAKTPDGKTINAGEAATFTIVVTNQGPGTVKNLHISDLLPGGPSPFVNWGTSTLGCSITGGLGSQTLTCDVATLAEGATFTAVVSATPTTASCGPMSNPLAVASAGNAASVNDSGSITCVPANLTVVKTPDGQTINAGDTATFTIVVSNTGTGTAKGVTLVDTLPNAGGVTWGTSSTNCSISATNPQVLTCTFGDMAGGSSATAVVTAASTRVACAAWPNLATATSTNTPTATDTGSITCQGANLTIAKTPDGQTINAGDTATFTIVVTNTGSGTALAVTLTDTLPSGGGVAWGTATAGCSVTAGVLNCAFGDLIGGASATVVVSGTTTFAACTTMPNTASASSTNAPTVTDGGSITCQKPNLTIAKTPDGQTISAGDTATFTIVVTNTGPGTAKSVTLTDTLPSGGGVAWGTPTAGCSVVAGVLSCAFGDLAAGQSRTVTVNGTTNLQACTAMPNTASTSATNNPAVTDGGSITCAPPGLTIVKTPDGQNISAGDTATFTIVVTNTGVGTAKGVTLTDTLPSGGGVTWTTSSAGCAVNAGVLTCAFGDLAGGASRTAVVSAVTSFAACAAMPNSATASATNGSPVSDAGNITCQKPNLTVDKTPDGQTITAGATATFTIVVTNTGLGTAKGVTLTDTLPTGGGVVWATSSVGCSVSGSNPQVLSCSFGDISAGFSRIAIVSGATSAQACTVMTNTAQAVATNNPAATDTGSITCTQNPALTVTKTPDGQGILPGDKATFTIVVASTGVGTATGVTLVDTLPAGGGVTWSTSTAGCSVSGAVGSQVLSCDIGDMAQGASFTAVVTTTTNLQACAVMNNVATASSTNAPPASDSGSIICGVPSKEIPTLSELAMLLLISLLALSGYAALRRQRRR